VLHGEAGVVEGDDVVPGGGVEVGPGDPLGRAAV
ncbi:MAG: hypothetical protein AVDCRST_MAG33-2634, partial [uncultured Thermomicrobiales bacterium]